MANSKTMLALISIWAVFSKEIEEIPDLDFNSKLEEINVFTQALHAANEVATRLQDFKEYSENFDKKEAFESQSGPEAEINDEPREALSKEINFVDVPF